MEKRNQNGDAMLEAASEEGAFEELRRLLFGAEQEVLREHEEQLGAIDKKVDVADVSRVLPAAVELRTQEDEDLREALAPTVEGALHDSVRSNPQRIVDAIFPVIGPAIRKSISDALSRMVESLNQVLEHSLSPRAMVWRFEAWRTKKPFGEIAILHSLVYRVEQVFLIHRPSGLLLQHVVAPSVSTQDAQMVSGMLTAIQDFVQDSFSTDGAQSVQSMRVGDVRVLVERGPHAAIAAVIRGTAPATLSSGLEGALESIHLSYAQPLRAFSGDAGPFEPARPTLETCLGEERKAAKRKRVPRFAIVFLLLLAAGIAWWMTSSVSANRRWDGFVESLRAEPGISVTHAEVSGGAHRIVGLRDPLSRDPAEMFTRAGFGDAKLETTWRSYHAADAEIAILRARRVLEPSASVQLDLADGVLNLAGTADVAWHASAMQLAPGIAGIDDVRDDALRVVGGDALVLARARDVLEAPDTVRVDFADGALTLAGTAPDAWIDDARLLARAIPGVIRVSAKDLRSADAAARKLAAAREILVPPPGVELELVKDAIRASGTAAESWLAEARLLARLVPDVSDVDLSGVQAIGREARILAKARSILRPPETVTLRLAGGDLIASGEASEDWIRDARLLVRVVPEVARLVDADVAVADRAARILAAARRLLQPPATVTLALDGERLVGSGTAPRDWILLARRLTPQVEGLSVFVEKDLLAREQTVLDQARASIEQREIRFERNQATPVLSLDPIARATAADLRRLRAAADALGSTVSLRIIGQVDQTAKGAAGHKLSLERADAVRAALIAHGVEGRLLRSTTKPAATLGSRPLNEAELARSRRVTFQVVVSRSSGR